MRQRGSLTVWVDEAAVSGWVCEQKSGKCGKCGAFRRYSEDAIQCALTLGSVYGLPLRGTVGLLQAVLELMGVRVDGYWAAGARFQHLKEVEKRGARAVFPPRRGARRADLEQKPHLAQRNAHIERIQELEAQGQDGRKRWKEETHYYHRRLVETDFFRLKTIFGNTLGARLFDSQATELFIRCAALNRITQLGMPQSYAR